LGDGEGQPSRQPSATQQQTHKINTNQISRFKKKKKKATTNNKQQTTNNKPCMSGVKSAYIMRVPDRQCAQHNVLEALFFLHPPCQNSQPLLVKHIRSSINLQIEGVRQLRAWGLGGNPPIHNLFHGDLEKIPQIFTGS
jgi:hypothetical protein